MRTIEWKEQTDGLWEARHVLVGTLGEAPSLDEAKVLCEHWLNTIGDYLDERNN